MVVRRLVANAINYGWPVMFPMALAAQAGVKVVGPFALMPWWVAVLPLLGDTTPLLLALTLGVTYFFVEWLDVDEED